MTVHLLIKGKVQGVFYRASAKDVAKDLRLSGWIRNTADGDVESMVTGDKDRVEEFVAWCKKGPARAAVTKVVVTEKEEEQFFNFVIVR
ncbi:MAG: acylphosphatase [Chitinophagaceae bacterium]|jgi:acylphosphatase|nr:acylphosphatase [Chitinophagaceae bacterium]